MQVYICAKHCINKAYDIYGQHGQRQPADGIKPVLHEPQGTSYMIKYVGSFRGVKNGWGGG